MFLCTTAEQTFWKTDRPVFFLGEWCKLYSQRHVWEKIPHEVLPYHWDDRKKLHKDYQYLQELYERVLANLARCLNIIHGEEHSLRYWRIIIGPWLFYFIQIFYDRYMCVLCAAQTGKVTDTIIGQYAFDAWIPQDQDDFNQWIVGDNYNFFLYSWIIRRLGLLPYTTRPAVQEYIRVRNSSAGSENIGAIKKLFKLYEAWLPNRFNKYVFVSSYLRSLEQCFLLLSMGQWPAAFSPKIEHEDQKVDRGWREKIKLFLQENDFEKILSEILGWQMPVAYVEGYAARRMAREQAYPSKPNVIFTANAFLFDEDFKLWAAEKMENGARLIASQHGGLYGVANFIAVEEHEIKVSDVYGSWGWSIDGESKIRVLPSSKLSSLKKGIPVDPSGKVLLVLGAMPRYSYHLYSVPVSSAGMLAYYEDLSVFVNGLNGQAQQYLLARPYSTDYGWSQKERFQDEFPRLCFDLGKKPMVEAMRSCRLFVTTYNATTYLESFVANFPTIMFWNPKYWELRSSAREYFEDLKTVGILHDTAESAASKVNEIFEDPLAWWSQKDVQQAKDRFCERFARISDNWLQEWRQMLLEQSSAGQKH